MTQFDKTVKGLKLQTIKRILNLSVPALSTVLRSNKEMPKTRIGRLIDQAFNEAIMNMQKDPKRLFKDHNFPRILDVYRKALVYITNVDGAYRGHLAYFLNVLFKLLMEAQIEFSKQIYKFADSKRFKNVNIHNHQHQQLLFYLWFTEAKGKYDFQTIHLYNE